MFKGFQKPKRLVANTETLTERYGMFTAQPFQRGFGTTIGNSLRRVLLSSIEGAAITAVRIEGVEHEFVHRLQQLKFDARGTGGGAGRQIRLEAQGVVARHDRLGQLAGCLGERKRFFGIKRGG